jgi:hypothetical protein
MIHFPWLEMTVYRSNPKSQTALLGKDLEDISENQQNIPLRS